LAVLIEMVAAYRPAVLKNRHVWAFFAMVTVCATAMFVYTAVETVGSNMDTYFTVTLVIWLASMVFGSAATFTTYIMGNKNRNVTAMGSRGRMLVQLSTVLSIIGAMMLLIASVGDVARVSDEWSTILTILSSTVLVANVLSLVASKKIFSEVMFEQRRMDGEE
jgi:peptidoglycan/LPS O-acetylase OafA/YrhL